MTGFTVVEVASTAVEEEAVELEELPIGAMSMAVAIVVTMAVMVPEEPTIIIAIITLTGTTVMVLTALGPMITI